MKSLFEGVGVRHWLGAVLLGLVLSVQFDAKAAPGPEQTPAEAQVSARDLKRLALIAAMCRGLNLTRSADQGPIAPADLVQLKLESPLCHVFNEKKI